MSYRPLSSTGRSGSRQPSMDSDQDDRVGPFPSWRWVYWTVVVYGLVVISFLTILTRVLSFGMAR